MAYPNAKIVSLTPEGLQEVAYEATEHFQITRDFLTHRESFLRNLLEAPELPSDEAGERD
jgi:predicted ATPase